MFKKIFLGLAAVAMFTACTGDYTDWAEPQHNAQADAVAFGNGSVSAVDLIDFANIPEGTDSVVVCNIVAPTASSASYSQPIYKLHLGESEYEIGANGKMAVEDLKAYLEANYGKAPYEREVASTVEQWISNGSTAIKTATSNEFTVKAKLLAPVIYPHLYLIGAPSEWSPTCTSMPFTHSGKDVYEDPVFTILFPATEGDTWFAVADDKTVETGEWSNVFGATEGNGNNYVGETGHIDRRTALSDDGSFKVTVNGDAKYIKMTCNMLDGTYLIEKVNYPQYIYFIGATDGWSQAEQKLESPDYDGHYTGFVYCADPNGWGNQFKFQKTPGDWGTEINAGHFTSFSGAATDCGGNIGVSGGENVYYFDVNLATGSISATEVTCMGVIGDFNGWGGDAVMTWNATDYCYEITNPGITAAGWKFRVNQGWDINLGGTVDKLVANGDNLSVVGNTVKLYPTRRGAANIYCTVE